MLRAVPDTVCYRLAATDCYCFRVLQAQLIIPLDMDGIGQNWDDSNIAYLQKMAVGEAKPTTGRRNEVGLAVRQATTKLLAESFHQPSFKVIESFCIALVRRS